MKKSPEGENISEVVKEILRESNADVKHAEHTAKLSLRLFDLLYILHTLGPRERFLLEISSMLHDIGWSRTSDRGHHKHSRDMINEARLPKITAKEKNICALIARYHNKAEPDASKHRKYAALKKSDRFIVSWCAAVLRVSDGLDCNHDSKVHIAGCNIEKGRLTILLRADSDCAREIRGAKRKGALLSLMSQRELVFSRC